MAKPGNFIGWVFRLSPGILGIASGLVLNTGWGATWSEIDDGLASTGVNVRAIVVAPLWVWRGTSPNHAATHCGGCGPGARY